MSRSLFALLLCTAFGISCRLPLANGQEKGRKNFLTALREGQAVVLKEAAGRYEITLLQGGHKVLEVGLDYVVIEDIAGVTETRIPIYSIKCINKIKVNRE